MLNEVVKFMEGKKNKDKRFLYVSLILSTRLKNKKLKIITENPLFLSL